MARYSKTLTPEAEAAFTAALGRGALVTAAAAEAGVALSSLYCRRRRDAEFAAAWAAAVAASDRRRYVPGQGDRPSRLGKTRRTRLSQQRREAFLAELATSCHTGDAAEAAGVHRSTVYRRIARDPAFAAACADALQRGYVRLAALDKEERAAAAARLREPIVATGKPTQDFELAMRLLARWERPARPRRADRGRKRLSHWEAVAELNRMIEAFGARRAEQSDRSV